jgi:DNA-binding NarL/FixJ family response regulator
MENKFQIIVVDDNAIFLEGISTFINKNKDYHTTAVFSSGTALLENLRDYDPDLILLDIEMPGLSGFETARRLSFLGDELKLVAITMYSDNLYLRQLIEAGFRGCVSKNEIAVQLIKVMDRVMIGELVFPEIKEG